MLNCAKITAELIKSGKIKIEISKDGLRQVSFTWLNEDF